MKKADLLRFANTTVADLVGPGLKLLFVGINPGLQTAATGAHFAHPANRFYPALALGGITEQRINATGGYSKSDRHYLIERGVGITNIAERATAKASELSRTELQQGAIRLRERVDRWNPRVVAVVGITAYRTAFNQPRSTLGRQPDRWGNTTLFVLGNPSGLNAHETAASLAIAYSEAAKQAGIELFPQRAASC